MAAAAAARRAAGAGGGRAPGDDGAAGAGQPAAAGVPAPGVPGRGRAGRTGACGEAGGPRARLDPVSLRGLRAAPPTARTWPELAAAARSCVACPELAATRTTVVVGDAPPGARLALVGEAPGAEEDRTGRPFVGKAGALLDRLLAEAGLDRGRGRGGQRAAVPAAGQPHPDRDRGDPLPRLAGAQARPGRTRAGRHARAVRGGRVPRPRRHGWRPSAARCTRSTAARMLPTYHPSAAIRFGPNGAPLAALRADLRTAAALLTSRS